MIDYGESVQKGNSFFQNAQNAKKLGAYYTDLDHCRRIGGLFDFDHAEEICALEPSIGDGKAILEVTGKRENIRIYGVELNRETYEEHLKENPAFAGILNEDFLSGVKISHGAFSFCFANPPYGESQNGKKRLEVMFLGSVSPLMKNGGYLALVIPFGVFSGERFFRLLMARYAVEKYFRFDEREYKKFHQVCVVLRKKPAGMGYRKSIFEELLREIKDLEMYPYLPEPEHVQERLIVPESKDRELEYFTTLKFQAEEAAQQLKDSLLFSELTSRIFCKPYTGCELNRPIVPVSKEISYLLAVIGGGQGYAGSEKEGTLHLQRGFAKRVEKQDVVPGEKGEPSKMVVSYYTEIGLNIIEDSGEITQL